MGKGRRGSVGWAIGACIGRRVARDDLQEDRGALGAEAGIIEVVEGTAQTVVEDGAAANCEGIVLVDAKAISVEGVIL